jgi:hypothetical protein
MVSVPGTASGSPPRRPAWPVLFSPTSRSGAQAALPFLEEYFGLLAHATPVVLDIEAELDWWQARREAVTPKVTVR